MSARDRPEAGGCNGGVVWWLKRQADQTSYAGGSKSGSVGDESDACPAAESTGRFVSLVVIRRSEEHQKRAPSLPAPKAPL